jgi:signal transduction histidine kinase
MRNRLTGWLVGAVLMTGLLIGIPLVVWADYGIVHQSQEQAEEAAKRTAGLLDLRVQQGLPNDSANLSPYVAPKRQVTITVLSSGESSTYGAQPAGRTVSASATGQYVTVDVLAPVVGSSIVIGLRILGTTAVAVVVAFMVARRWSRRFSDALDELAQDAERIGSGDTRPARRHGMADLDQVAQALDDSSRRVHELVRVERAFTSDVTHQLRTPLTAISLRLDEVAAAETLAIARHEAAAAQEQVERLTHVITDLHQASVQREADRHPFPLDPLLRRQYDEWSPVFRSQGRVFVEPAPTGLMVVGATGALGQIIAILLENASVHGAGAVTVSVRTAGTGVVIEVADEGDGIPDTLGALVFERAVSSEPTGSGLGLSLARALAEHMGGRLELVSARPAVFGVFLALADQGGGLPAPGYEDEGGDQARETMVSVDSL